MGNGEDFAEQVIDQRERARLAALDMAVRLEEARIAAVGVSSTTTEEIVETATKFRTFLAAEA